MGARVRRSPDRRKVTINRLKRRPIISDGFYDTAGAILHRTARRTAALERSRSLSVAQERLIRCTLSIAGCHFVPNNYSAVTACCCIPQFRLCERFSKREGDRYRGTPRKTEKRSCSRWGGYVERARFTTESRSFTTTIERYLASLGHLPRATAL